MRNVCVITDRYYEAHYFTITRCCCCCKHNNEIFYKLVMVVVVVKIVANTIETITNYDTL